MSAATDLSVDVGGLTWPTPVGLASGCCGYGRELEDRVDGVDFGKIGAIFTKGLSLEPREGNAPEWASNPSGRITEVPGAMINAIGLANPGVHAFISDKLPWLAEWRERHGGRVIANIFGESVEEYAELARRLDSADGVDGVELNLSCPNVEKGGLEFGQDAEACARVTAAVREVTGKFMAVKLSPACDVAALSVAAERAGAQALSISNTLPVSQAALALDPVPELPSMGGISGPVLRPLALEATRNARAASSLAIIGIGGIATADHAREFFAAGACAVQVGTALFGDPDVCARICSGISVPV
ncbi:MAG TPA: dihydroorotate dehydrogenase [Deltaproteobacteria bacterium]|nr:dihydroorotate dehydrogenase [Candidatus Binatota bacterium]HIL12040.1 dihydroorotate dehydrogenase [Deltaproteobacteria bacterium]